MEWFLYDRNVPHEWVKKMNNGRSSDPSEVVSVVPKTSIGASNEQTTFLIDSLIK